MPHELIKMQETITNEFLSKVMHKKELFNMQMTLQILHNNYTYLKIPKDHAHM